MNERAFQKQLASLVTRYDAAMRAPKKEKDAFDDEWNGMMMACNEEQAGRALDLLTLHSTNKMFTQ